MGRDKYLIVECEITFTKKDFGSSMLWKRDITSKCDAVRQIVTAVVIALPSVIFLVTIALIQGRKPWEESDMTFYLIVGCIWVFHRVCYFICFVLTLCMPELLTIDKKSSSEKHQAEDHQQHDTQEQRQVQDGQAKDGDQNQQAPMTNPLIEVSRFHLRNERVHSLACGKITNFIIIGVVGVAIYGFIRGSTEFYQLKQNENVQLAKNVSIQKRDSLSRVDICNPDMFDLSWLDYAYISRIAYQSSSLDLSKMEKLFTDRGFTITINSEIIHYAILHHELTKLTIISFRGTNSKLDGIHDAKILIEAVIPNLAVPFFPIPFQTKEWIGRMFSYTGSRAWSAGPLSLVKNGNEVVTGLVKKYGADNVVVTGHSLGGGLAYIIGTTNNLVNYGVSPPGSGIGKFMNKYTQEQVVKYVHALVPQRDPVAVLGSQQGNVVHIPCREPDSLSCHSLDATICMLSSICGDTYLADSCAPYWEKWQNAPKDYS